MGVIRQVATPAGWQGRPWNELAEAFIAAGLWEPKRTRVGGLSDADAWNVVTPSLRRRPVPVHCVHCWHRLDKLVPAHATPTVTSVRGGRPGGAREAGPGDEVDVATKDMGRLRWRCRCRSPRTGRRRDYVVTQERLVEIYLAKGGDPSPVIIAGGDF